MSICMTFIFQAEICALTISLLWTSSLLAVTYLFFVNINVFLFCSICLYFCFRIPHVNELIKYLSFSDFCHLASLWSIQVIKNGKISLFYDWVGFDLLAVQEILKNLLQHHSSKPSVLHHSTFFMVQLPHLYLSTENIIALTIQTLLLLIPLLKLLLPQTLLCLIVDV